MEQGICTDSTRMPGGQDTYVDRADGLDAAATKLLTAEQPPLSVGVAIETHRAAREALCLACPAMDEVAVLAAGGDVSDEGMAPAKAIWEAANLQEIKAFEELLSCRPATPEGFAQMLAYIAESPALGDLDDSTNALRQIADAAANVAMENARSSVSPAVAVAARAAWDAYADLRPVDLEYSAGRISDGVWKVAYDRADKTLDQLSRVEGTTWLDMACKCLALGADEVWELSTDDDPANDTRSKRIGRQFNAMIDAGVKVGGVASPVVDPIFVAIEEGRRLLAISDAAFAIPVPPKGDTPKEIEEATTKALRDLVEHCRGVLLQIVPQTAAGCRELARFAVEYFEHQDVPIDDDEQAVTSLIARSPLLAAATASPPMVDELLDGWAEWTKTDGKDASEFDWQRAADIRDALLYRAAALPATRENMPAKAVAQAWLEYVMVWERNKPRDSYGIDGDLCLAIHDALCRETEAVS